MDVTPNTKLDVTLEENVDTKMDVTLNTKLDAKKRLKTRHNYDSN